MARKSKNYGLDDVNINDEEVVANYFYSLHAFNVAVGGVEGSEMVENIKILWLRKEMLE